MKTLSLLLAFSLIANNVALGADPTATDIVQGQEAPYSGVLLSHPQADLIKQQLVDADYQKILNDSLTKQVALYKGNVELEEQRSAVYAKQNEDLSKRVVEDKSFSSWNSVMWFALGIIGSGLAYSAIKRAP